MVDDVNETVPMRNREDERVGSSSTLAIGSRIGKYEILAVLGQGGFGITYRARDTQLGREIAIKEYLPTAFAVREQDGTVLPRWTQAAANFRWGRERFLDEAKTLALLEDAAGIVNVYDFLEANGTAYMVMALVRGETLEARLRRDRIISPMAVDQLLYFLLKGLERVHDAGFLHRDIKPANILIDRDAQPTLIDFGASRAALLGRTQTLTAVYTPGYAAFEQFTSAKQGPWTDIYALGATLYHCVTGEQPPSASDRMIEDSLTPVAEAAKGRYAARLLAAIDAALQLRPTDRPRSIVEWRQIAFGTTEPTQFVPMGPRTQVATVRMARAGPAEVGELPKAGGRSLLLVPEMLRIPGGSFVMGSPPDETDHLTTEAPQHQVSIEHPFHLGRYAVTRGEFASFLRSTGHKAASDWQNLSFTQNDRHPAGHVTWHDAKAYAAWLAECTGKPFRLPTEAEWEYAARAGTMDARYWGGDLQDARNHAHADCFSTGPVGRFPPNAFGLHDMLGNGWEWVEDCWHDDYDGAPGDGSAWFDDDCGRRVLRGGSWSTRSDSLRAAARLKSDPGYRDKTFGFRVALTE
ncbi:MAG TPA: bifunctional serine/threonine-protein kinase/formylglycine-generating enzyme family protein [Vineibacter sp.]|nr:bifunctional serine/threonine-protein kinase/formylglycine-generating enzyme family protein [Vineibacter sp.]